MLKTLMSIGDSLIFIFIWAIILTPIIFASRFLFKKKDNSLSNNEMVSVQEKTLVSTGVAKLLKAILFIGLSFLLTMGMYAVVKNDSSPETSTFSLLILFPLSFVISAALLRLGSYISKNILIK
jgi:hypothetical protein